jgi:small subunit ribosomal protein S17
MSDTIEQAGLNVATTETGKIVGSRIGTVETDGRDKTRKVVINYKQKHPKYGKYVSARTVLHVHDENNESRRGDRVEVAPCRPISKTKKWTLVRVVERGVSE